MPNLVTLPVSPRLDLAFQTGVPPDAFNKFVRFTRPPVVLTNTTMPVEELATTASQAALRNTKDLRFAQGLVRLTGGLALKAVAALLTDMVFPEAVGADSTRSGMEARIQQQTLQAIGKSQIKPQSKEDKLQQSLAQIQQAFPGQPFQLLQGITERTKGFEQSLLACMVGNKLIPLMLGAEVVPNPLQHIPSSPATTTPAPATQTLRQQAEAQKQQLLQQQTRAAFDTALERARSANAQLTSAADRAAGLHAQAQKLITQFYWQATGGRAALGGLSQTLKQLESLIQAQRELYQASNAPVTALKQALKQMQQIRAGAGGARLAPETTEAQQQVAQWARARNNLRTEWSAWKNKTLAPWMEQAYGYLSALKQTGGQSPQALLPSVPAQAPAWLREAAKAAAETLSIAQRGIPTPTPPIANPGVEQSPAPLKTPLTEHDLSRVNNQDPEQRETRQRKDWKQAREEADRIRARERARVKLRPETEQEERARLDAIADSRVRSMVEGGNPFGTPELEGVTGTGQIKAGAGTGAEGAGAVQVGAGKTAKPLTWALNTFGYGKIREYYSSDTPEGRRRLLELLATRSKISTVTGKIALPGAPSALPRIKVHFNLLRDALNYPNKILLQFHLGSFPESLESEYLKYFRGLGITDPKLFKHTLDMRISNGHILIPGSPEPGRPISSWGIGGLPNVYGHFGLPPSFFDRELNAEKFSKQVENMGKDNDGDLSWIPSATQKQALKNLFIHRDDLKSLLSRPYNSRDEAIQDLAQVLRNMEQCTPNMFPVELSFHIAPRGSHGKQWGIGLGAIGQDEHVATFFLNSNSENNQPTDLSPAWLHIHPSLASQAPHQTEVLTGGLQLSPFPKKDTKENHLSGFSMQDLIAALTLKRSMMVYDNGVLIELKIKDSWFNFSNEQREEILDYLVSTRTRMINLLSTSSPEQITQAPPPWLQEARRRIAQLPVAFDIVEPNPYPQRTAPLSVRGVRLYSIPDGQIE